MSSSLRADYKFDFQSYLLSKRALVEERLADYLKDGEPKVLWDAMRYSVLSGGKRMRALLCLAAAETISLSECSGAPHTPPLSLENAIEAALPCAAAIEMVHAMSLIHDDLPALDNDDFRRGKPTNHKVFGEAMALLAGDALLMLPIEILLTATPSTVSRERLLRVVLELTRATGAQGMVGGQVADMIFTGGLNEEQQEGKRGEQPCAAERAMPDGERSGAREPSKAERLNIDKTSPTYSIESIRCSIDESTLESIHRGKTGALIRFSIWSGACLAGADESKLKDLSRFGEILGLAFQITDDLLDVTGDIKTLGKTPGKDEASKKTTWVTVFGVDGCKSKLAQLEDEGMRILSTTGLDQKSFPALTALLQYAIHRLN